MAKRDGLRAALRFAERTVGKWPGGGCGGPPLVETTSCADVVASTYQAMGLVTGDRPSYYYDPGSSCSDGDLELAAGAMLDDEIAVDIRDGGEGNA